MKDILSLRLYARVARLGSFSAAAREFALAQSQVSRMVAELEASLGVKLLSRTTRAVVPTEAGTEFLVRIEPVLAALDDAENSVRDSGAFRGLLRVGMPTPLGLRMVMPRLAPFTERHPELHVELILDDRWQDMVREAVDVGLRVGALPDAGGTARLITTIERVIVAAPSYLARAGTPQHPADLKRHRIVGGPATMRATAWQFSRAGEQIAVDLRPHVSNNTLSGAVACVAGGMGVTSTTIWACRQELAAGALVRLLPDWDTVALPVNAYFPLGRATRKVARAFVDFIAGALMQEDVG